MESIKDKLKTMFEMQEALNVYTNGADYKETKVCAKTGKPINYRRCAWMEMAEFVDSFDWKHWKHGNNDIENAKTELVDIWHFLMSAELIENGMPSDKKLGAGASMFFGAPNSDTIFETDSYCIDVIISIAENLLFYLMWPKSTIIKSEKDTGVLNDFSKLCATIGLSFDKLYQRYIIKNTLNKFRQDNGYAEGQYVKNWAWGKEDNVFAVMLADGIGNNLTADNLYSVLDYFYKNLLSANDVFDGLTDEQALAIEANCGFRIVLKNTGVVTPPIIAFENVEPFEGIIEFEPPSSREPKKRTPEIDIVDDTDLWYFK